MVRYITAIIFAVIGAAISFRFLAGPVSDWAALQPAFESSDDAETVNQMAFMVVNFLGLLVGWTIGWLTGGILGGRSAPGPSA